MIGLLARLDRGERPRGSSRPTGGGGQAVAGQVHRDVVVGVGDERVLDVLGHVDQDRAGPAGAGDVERLLDDPGDVAGVLHQVMVLGDRPADLDHRRFLERVGADDVGRDLAGDRDDRQRVHLGVGQAGDEVQGPGAGGGHHDAGLAGDAGVALGGEDPPLLVAGQDRPDLVAVAGQRLVHRHARPARVGEDDLDAVPDQGLDQDVGPGGRVGGGSRSASVVDGGHVENPSGRLGPGNAEDSHRTQEGYCKGSPGLGRQPRTPGFARPEPDGRSRSPRDRSRRDRRRARHLSTAGVRPSTCRPGRRPSRDPQPDGGRPEVARLAGTRPLRGLAEAILGPVASRCVGSCSTRRPGQLEGGLASGLDDRRAGASRGRRLRAVVGEGRHPARPAADRLAGPDARAPAPPGPVRRGQWPVCAYAGSHAAGQIDAEEIAGWRHRDGIRSCRRCGGAIG